MRTLVMRAAARALALLVAVAAMLAGLQVLVVVIAADQYRSGSFDLLMRIAPSFVQRQLGDSLPLLLSFPGLVTFGYFHPVVILTITMVAALVASEPAGDVERGYVDLLLARSIPRHWLLTRSLLLVLTVPVLLVLVMMATTWAALAAFAPPAAPRPAFAALVRLAAHLVALSWWVGALALLFAAYARRRAGALAPAAVLAVSLYLFELLAGAWPPLRVFGAASPFHYFQGSAVLAGSARTPADVAVLVAMAAPLVALAYVQFARRDL